MAVAGKTRQAVVAVEEAKSAIGNMIFKRSSHLPAPGRGVPSLRGGVREHDGVPKYHSVFRTQMVAAERSEAGDS